MAKLQWERDGGAHVAGAFTINNGYWVDDDGAMHPRVDLYCGVSTISRHKSVSEAKRAAQRIADKILKNTEAK